MRGTKLYLLISLLFFLLIGVIYYCFNSIWERAKQELYADLTTQIVLEVSYNSPFFFSKNSVGNEWGYVAKVNDKLLISSTSVVIDIDLHSVIVIAACAQENDNVPDVGCNQRDIDVSSLNLSSDNKFELLVDVTENRGRYSGNIAIVPFHFNFRRIVTNDEIQDRFWGITKRYIGLED